MRSKPKIDETLSHWAGLPERLHNAVKHLDDAALDRRFDTGQWSIREYIHHIVEANLIASNMIIAALAADGCNFDWTWVMPDRGWSYRLGYDKADVLPAIAALEAVIRHISGLILTQEDAIDRKVMLNDSLGAERYAATIGDIIQREITHAEEHLTEVGKIQRY